jgi:FemAB-related protein (PEP-CTERM system-associated)
MGSLTIREYTGSGEDWDAFVKQLSSCFYHQFAYQYVVREYFKFIPVYLSAYKNGVLVGVLPLFLSKSIFFGKGLVSLPGADEAGVVAEDETVANALADYALNIAKKIGVDYMELRHNSNIFPEVYSYTSRAIFYLKLPDDPEILWRSIDQNKRNKVRKALRAGLSFRVVPSNQVPSFLPLFVRINALNKQHLGSPFYGLSYFLSLYNHFPQQVHLFFVETKEKIPIGSAMRLSFNGRLSAVAAGSLHKFFPLAPNDLLYWGIIEFACKKGYALLDFGRSPIDSGAFQFKKQWKADVVQLYYHRWCLNNSTFSLQTTDTMRSSSLMQIASEVWKHLPYLAVKTLGPYLVKHFP